jgi:hypothetical protein
MGHGPRGIIKVIDAPGSEGETLWPSVFEKEAEYDA